MTKPSTSPSTLHAPSLNQHRHTPFLQSCWSQCTNSVRHCFDTHPLLRPTPPVVHDYWLSIIACLLTMGRRDLHSSNGQCEPCTVSVAAVKNVFPQVAMHRRQPPILPKTSRRRWVISCSDLAAMKLQVLHAHLCLPHVAQD